MRIAHPLININEPASYHQSQLQAQLACTSKGDEEFSDDAAHFAQAIVHAQSQGVTFNNSGDVRYHLRDKPLSAFGISGEGSHKKLLVDGLVIDERVVYWWE